MVLRFEQPHSSRRASRSLDSRAKLACAAALLSISACAAPANATASIAAPRPTPPPARPAVTLSKIAKTEWEPFDAWKLERSDGPPVDVYVARKGGARPTILLLPGSKCFPLFWVLPGRRISALFLQGAVPKAVEEVNVVAFDRRGLKSFGPPPQSKEAAAAQAVCTPERGGVSKVERVDDATAVALALLEKPWVSELWVVGHSEGGDVAAGVAKRLGDRVAAVGLFAGAGITRYFEKITGARRKGGSVGAVKVFEEMLVATGPNPPPELDGDPLVLVKTFAIDSTPLDDLRGLRTPVFVTHGDGDDKAVIEAADAFVAELLRESTRPVSYLICPGCDHGLVDTKGRDRSEETLRLFIDWARLEVKPRGVRVLPD